MRACVGSPLQSPELTSAIIQQASRSEGAGLAAAPGQMLASQTIVIRQSMLRQGLSASPSQTAFFPPPGGPGLGAAGSWHPPQQGSGGSGLQSSLQDPQRESFVKTPTCLCGRWAEPPDATEGPLGNSSALFWGCREPSRLRGSTSAAHPDWSQAGPCEHCLGGTSPPQIKFLRSHLLNTILNTTAIIWPGGLCARDPHTHPVI